MHGECTESVSGTVIVSSQKSQNEQLFWPDYVAIQLELLDGKDALAWYQTRTTRPLLLFSQCFQFLEKPFFVGI